MSNSELLADSIAAWNKGDLDTYMLLYGEDATVHSAEGPQDKAETRTFYEGLHAASPGNQIVVEDEVDGDDHIALRFQLEDSSGAPFMTGLTILHFSDGRCSERWTLAVPIPPA